MDEVMLVLGVVAAGLGIMALFAFTQNIWYGDLRYAVLMFAAAIVAAASSIAAFLQS